MRTPFDDLLSQFFPLADLAFEAAQPRLQFLHLEFFQLQLQVERGCQQVFEFALMLGNRLPVLFGLPVRLELPDRRRFSGCGGLLSVKLLDQLFGVRSVWKTAGRRRFHSQTGRWNVQFPNGGFGIHQSLDW